MSERCQVCDHPIRWGPWQGREQWLHSSSLPTPKPAHRAVGPASEADRQTATYVASKQAGEPRQGDRQAPTQDTKGDAT